MPPSPSRIAAARRRAYTAKVLLAAGGLALFGTSMALARANHAGHVRHGVRPLQAPPMFVSAVHRDQLQGGIVAPPQAPPSAVTAVS
jgi:hypothetical protein